MRRKRGRQMSPVRRLLGDDPAEPSLIARIPGLVIPGGFGPAALRQHRTARATCRRRAGQVGLVRLLPSIGFYRFRRRRRIDDVVEPAVPPRWDQRCFGKAAIDHPTALDTKRRIDLAVPGPVIAIAEFVFTNELAV